MRTTRPHARRVLLRPGSIAFALLLAAPGVHAGPAFPRPSLGPARVTLTGQEIPAPRPGLTLPRWRPADESGRLDAIDRSLVTSFALLSAADAWQTGHIPEGFREGNPLIASWAGSRPTVGEAMAFKAVVATGLLQAGRRIERPRQRRAALLLMNGLQLAVVALNERRTGGILFP